MGGDWATAGLWLAVAASGLYHGLSPGMGWPLAVSAGLMGGGRGELLRALGPLALGHFIAMLAILLPFTLLVTLIRWEWEIRAAAALMLVGAGLVLLFWRRHPRALARIAPHRLAFWSFAVAMAHGAGLMLLPAYLGLCGLDLDAADHAALGTLMRTSLPLALLVAVLHTAAMIAAGGTVAVLVHAWLGLGFLRRSWLNLDAVWAASLVLVGGISLYLIGPRPL